MPPGEAVFGFSTKASMWVTSIGSAALLARVTWGLGLIVFAIFVVIHSRLVRNFRIAVIETMNQTEKLRRTSYCGTCRPRRTRPGKCASSAWLTSSVMPTSRGGAPT